MKIQDKALLASLSLSVWTARKLERRASKVAADHYHASEVSINTTKAAIAKKDLAAIVTAAGALRTYHYSVTLPYDKGYQILPCDLLPEYMGKIAELRATFEAHVAEFLGNYDHLIDEARAALGGLFNPADYPSRSNVARKFAVSVDFSPIPEGSHVRVAIDQADLDAIKAGIEDRVNGAIQESVSEVWSRLHKVIEALRDRMTPDDNGEIKSFRDSIIGNIKRLCDILPALNLTGNQELADLGHDVQTYLCGFEARELRENAEARNEARKTAEQILKKIGAATGAAPQAPEPDPVPKSDPEPEPDQEPEPGADADDIIKKMAEAGLI